MRVWMKGPTKFKLSWDYIIQIHKQPRCYLGLNVKYDDVKLFLHVKSEQSVKNLN